MDDAAHRSDVARLAILRKYGGIYLDLDMVILQSLKSLYEYDVTVGLETPENIGNAFIIARRDAAYLKLWYDSYKTFNDSEWDTHSLRIPLKLGIRNPSLVHIEPFTIYSPNWRQTEWLYGEGKLWDWIDNYALHLYSRYAPKGDLDPDSIRTLNTTVGEVFRFIIYGDYSIRND